MNRVLWLVLKQITIWQSERQITAAEASQFLSQLEAAQGMAATNGDKPRKGPGRPKKEDAGPLLPSMTTGSATDHDAETAGPAHP